MLLAPLSPTNVIFDFIYEVISKIQEHTTVNSFYVILLHFHVLFTIIRFLPIHFTEKLPLYLIVLPTGGGFHSPDIYGLQCAIGLLSPFYLQIENKMKDKAGRRIKEKL